jgi:hypothetical protein
VRRSIAAIVVPSIRKPARRHHNRLKSPLRRHGGVAIPRIGDHNAAYYLQRHPPATNPSGGNEKRRRDVMRVSLLALALLASAALFPATTWAESTQSARPAMATLAH